MGNSHPPRRADQSAHYIIEVRGRLDPQRADWFAGMTISTRRDAGGQPVAKLAGSLPDQAALHGVLNKLHTLGLTLLSVQRVEKGATP